MHCYAYIIALFEHLCNRGNSKNKKTAIRTNAKTEKKHELYILKQRADLSAQKKKSVSEETLKICCKTVGVGDKKG